MNTIKIPTKVIKKTVANSQKIEGYKPSSKDIKEKAREVMLKNNVKISAWQ